MRDVESAVGYAGISAQLRNPVLRHSLSPSNPSRIGGFVMSGGDRMAEVLHVTDASTRSEIAEALTNLCARARREMPVVGSEDLPTPWDKRHQAIDELLSDYEQAPA